MLAGRSLRFTPTCVGTIKEYINHWGPQYGSPPRAWGQSAKVSRDLAVSRFTPTCVGTMECVYVARASASGSPPRAWGQYHGIVCREWSDLKM